jgi:hypothetical protein
MQVRRAWPDLDGVAFRRPDVRETVRQECPTKFVMPKTSNGQTVAISETHTRWAIRSR